METMTITKREAEIIEDALENNEFEDLDAEEELLLERVKEFIKENER